MVVDPFEFPSRCGGDVQNATVSSMDPEAKTLPLGEKTTELTQREWGLLKE